MKAINPATQEVMGEYVEHGEMEVGQLVERAGLAAEGWRRMSAGDRAVRLRAAAGLLRERSKRYAELMTVEMGKPIAQAEAEIEKCAVACDYFGEMGEAFLSPREMPAGEATKRRPRGSDGATKGGGGGRCYVRYDPLGVVLAIMPWNFPFWQVFRAGAPAVMAGNVVLLKHAPNVPGCALAIEEVFRESGFEEGVMTALLIGEEATAGVIGREEVRGVTVTGSPRAGEAVAGAAGRLLKKTVLELGGSDAFVVLGDVDVEEVAKAAAKARCINTGQSCIAAKRFIVVERVAERFTEALAEAMRKMRVGDPMDRKTDLGPLAREDLRDNLHRQVEASVGAGARVVVGGSKREGRGYFYEPTVLEGVTPGMAAFDEETFGPVAAVVRARDEAEAVRLANASQYGLGASIWTKDIELAERLAGEIEAGCVFINGMVQSDPRQPFGGIKRSGYGRELADVGMHEFVNMKTVVVV